MSHSVEDQAGYDALRSSLDDLFGALATGRMDRPRIEEELVFLAEQFGAYVLVLEDEEGILRFGMCRESPSPRAVIGQLHGSGRRLEGVVRLG